MYKPEQFAVPEAFGRNDWSPPPHVAAVIAEREQGKANLNSQFSFTTTRARGAGGRRADRRHDRADRRRRSAACWRTLKATGLADDTVTIFTSRPRRAPGRPRAAAQGLRAVPADHPRAVRVVGHRRRGVAAQACAASAIGSTIDISATILDRAEGRALRRHPGAQPAAGDLGEATKARARRRVRAVRSPAAERGARRRAAHPHAGRRALAAEPVRRRRVGRAVRPRRTIPASSSNLWDDPASRDGEGAG